MRPLNGQGDGASPASSNGSASRDGAEELRLREVRNTLRQTMDVFSDDQGDGAELQHHKPGTGNVVHRPLIQQQVRETHAMRAEPRPTLSVPSYLPEAEEEETPRRRMPWIVGGTVAVVLAAVVTFFLLNPSFSGDERTLVRLGDSLMAAGNYEGARVRYTAALDIQPGNVYVRQQVRHLDSLAASLRRLGGDVDAQYGRLVAEGDSLMKLYARFVASEPALAGQVRSAAREAYLRALVYRPDDQVIRTRLRDEFGVQIGTETPADDPAALARQKEQAESYRKAIEAGDRFMTSGNFLEAQMRYKEALTYKLGDPYAAQRLELIANQVKEADRDERLAAYKRRGDEFFRDRLFDQALMAYREALAIRPNDQALIARINETEDLERDAQQQLAGARERARQVQAAQAYQTAVSEGDAMMNQGRFEQAMEHFAAALRQYPSDATLTQKHDAAVAAVRKQSRMDANGVYRFLAEDESPRLLSSLKEIYATITYPPSAIKDRLEGRVFVEFVVDPQGSVRNARVMKGLSPDLDREAIKAISKARYAPAKVDGKAVSVYQTLYVTFKIPER